METFNVTCEMAEQLTLVLVSCSMGADIIDLGSGDDNDDDDCDGGFGGEDDYIICIDYSFRKLVLETSFRNRNR